MPRTQPTNKLGVYGQYDINPENAVSLYLESKLKNKCYIKPPNWDTAHLGFDLKGIQQNRHYEEVAKEQAHMRFHSQEQFRQNEKSLAEANKKLDALWNDFVEVNTFVKDCESKENESFEIMANDREKQRVYNEKIEQLDQSLEKLNVFFEKYKSVIEQYEPFEEVLRKTIKMNTTFSTVDDLMKRSDSLLLAQVEISKIEQEKIKEIEATRANLLKSTKAALQIITGLNNDLSQLQGQYTEAWNECLKWEKSITTSKSYMKDNEMKTNVISDAIYHLYSLISKRLGEPPKFIRQEVENQLDFIKEEIGTLQAILNIAVAKMMRDKMSVSVEKGSSKYLGQQKRSD
ncbi:myosin heavy chain, skeletal muscle-like [Uranotaenia lowii]|uniref:myosin heavy chain, skeletal muscle-like n=1 Tax=Uranotaenia lowii TaxID=190385 RepID=UPI00247A6F59|nr:myosin heavy chain, skeletal muscle-like [Uranotaenia lowii]